MLNYKSFVSYFWLVLLSEKLCLCHEAQLALQSSPSTLEVSTPKVIAVDIDKIQVISSIIFDFKTETPPEENEQIVCHSYFRESGSQSYIAVPSKIKVKTESDKRWRENPTINLSFDEKNGLAIGKSMNRRILMMTQTFSDVLPNKNYSFKLHFKCDLHEGGGIFSESHDNGKPHFLQVSPSSMYVNTSVFNKIEKHSQQQQQQQQQQQEQQQQQQQQSTTSDEKQEIQKKVYEEEIQEQKIVNQLLREKLIKLQQNSNIRRKSTSSEPHQLQSQGQDESLSQCNLNNDRVSFDIPVNINQGEVHNPEFVFIILSVCSFLLVCLTFLLLGKIFFWSYDNSQDTETLKENDYEVETEQLLDELVEGQKQKQKEEWVGEEKIVEDNTFVEEDVSIKEFDLKMQVEKEKYQHEISEEEKQKDVVEQEIKEREEEITNYKTQVNEKNECIQELNVKICTQDSVLSELKEKIADKKDELKLTEEEVQRKEQEERDLKKSLKESDDQCNLLRARLESCGNMNDDNNINILKQELEDKEKDLDCLKHQIQEKNDQMMYLKLEMDKNSENCAVLEKELEDKNKSLENIRSEVDQKKKEWTGLNIQICEAENSLKNFNLALDVNRKNIEEIKAKSKIVEEQINEKKQELNLVRTQYKQKNLDLRSLESELEKYNDVSLHEYKTETKQMEEDSAALKEKLEHKKAEFFSLQAQIQYSQELEKENDLLKSTISETEKKKNEISENFERANNDLTSTAEEKQILHDQLSEIKEKHEKLKLRYQEKSTADQEKLRKFEETRVELNELVSQTAVKDEEIVLLKKKVDHEKEIQLRNERKATILNEDLEKTRTQLDYYTSKLETSEIFATNQVQKNAQLMLEIKYYENRVKDVYRKNSQEKSEAMYREFEKDKHLNDMKAIKRINEVKEDFEQKNKEKDVKVKKLEKTNKKLEKIQEATRENLVDLSKKMKNHKSRLASSLRKSSFSGTIENNDECQNSDAEMELRDKLSSSLAHNLASGEHETENVNPNEVSNKESRQTKLSQSQWNKKLREATGVSPSKLDPEIRKISVEKTKITLPKSFNNCKNNAL